MMTAASSSTRSFQMLRRYIRDGTLFRENSAASRGCKATRRRAALALHAAFPFHLQTNTADPYLNNVVEQDHRGIKRRVNASQGFRSFDGAWRTIQGYEVLHMIRKGQVRWLPKGDVLGQIQFIREILGLKTE
jgi:hypothetical protein